MLIEEGTQQIASSLYPYEQMNLFSCASAALTISYRALGLTYSELDIRKDLGKKSTEVLSWLDMLKHPRTKGFETSFYYEEPYESLLYRFYDDDSVVIVGWVPLDNQARFHHYSPVKAINLENIVLVDSDLGNFEGLPRRKFEQFWRDYTYTHPFMTIKKTK